MGSIQKFLMALEAEDITQGVENETKKAIGKQSVTSTRAPKRNIMETDDILGTKKVQNKPAKNVTPVPAIQDDDTEDDNDNINDDTDPNDETDPGADDTDDINLDPDDDTGDEDGDDTDDTDMLEEPESAEDRDEFNNKVRLRENMILFYNILTENLQLLSEYIPSGDSAESNKIMYNVRKSLADSREILYRIITEELNEKPYVDLLRKYIALNRVYDINLQILNKYFTQFSLAGENKNKKNDKDKNTGEKDKDISSNDKKTAKNKAEI